VLEAGKSFLNAVPTIAAEIGRQRSAAAPHELVDAERTAAAAPAGNCLKVSMT
jgi:hypothetical protein